MINQLHDFYFSMQCAIMIILSSWHTSAMILDKKLMVHSGKSIKIYCIDLLIRPHKMHNNASTYPEFYSTVLFLVRKNVFPSKRQ